VHRLTGAPGTGIAAFAAERGTELVCMATRGTGAMHHLLMGSVALQTAQASGVPVVLMR
jgi:nucleotide-binding universal stress UspA family protein